MKTSKYNYFYKKIKYFWWIFRWFIIGNFYCKLTSGKRHVMYILHKFFWFIIIVLVPLGLAYLKFIYFDSKYFV